MDSFLKLKTPVLCILNILAEITHIAFTLKNNPTLTDCLNLKKKCSNKTTVGITFTYIPFHLFSTIMPKFLDLRGFEFHYFVVAAVWAFCLFLFFSLSLVIGKVCINSPQNLVTASLFQGQKCLMGTGHAAAFCADQLRQRYENTDVATCRLHKYF